MSRGLRLFTLCAVLGMVLVAGTANATHSWGGYHWARTANPFTLKFGDNVTSNWDAYLSTAISDWSVTSGSCNNPLNPVRGTIIAGSANPKNCRPTSGTIQVCNSSYGNNGWLGLASIWVTGGVHIVQGTVKVNDYYFNQAQYNTPAWHSSVMDQETGHTLGLDHQDTDFNNADLLDACGRGSCMDYSSDPANNTTPNQHDYDELVTIYTHLDSSTTIGASLPPSANAAADVDPSDQSAWGNPVKFANGRAIAFERDLGAGAKMLTYVIWAQ